LHSRSFTGKDPRLIQLAAQIVDGNSLVIFGFGSFDDVEVGVVAIGNDDTLDRLAQSLPAVSP
jgi:hypothetical protein